MRLRIHFFFSLDNLSIQKQFFELSFISLFGLVIRLGLK